MFLCMNCVCPSGCPRRAGVARLPHAGAALVLRVPHPLHRAAHHAGQQHAARTRLATLHGQIFNGRI